MDITFTIFGQSAAFFVFWWFCSTKVWPLFSNVLEERKQRIADGLEAAARAQKDLELAQNASTDQLREAKEQAASIIDQANKRASQIVEEAKVQAREEANRVKAAAEAEVEQQVNQAKEALRAQVAALAIAGAEKILEAAVDEKAHAQLVDKLAAEL